MKLLVFPCDCESDTGLFKTLESMGVEVIGGSSISTQGFLGKETLFLPYITDDLFEYELSKLVKLHAITHLYTSHSGVWGLFSERESALQKKLSITLCSDFPFDNAYSLFKPHLSWGKDAYQRGSIEGGGQRLSAEQLSSLCANFHQIPGQSDSQKLEALVSLAPSIPQGDWVEIGSLYGRSSYALGYLAHIYHQANLVCIDPWDLARIVPQKGKAEMLDGHARLVDLDKIFEIFKCSIALLDNVTYIRESSEEALPRYLGADFDGKKVAIEHRIAFLHIDGSHHFDEVTKDIALWEPHVRIGGWIAIDDYLWAFGDGPKRAGDNLLNTGRFDTAFVSGDTLYLRKNARE